MKPRYLVLLAAASVAAVAAAGCGDDGASKSPSAAAPAGRFSGSPLPAGLPVPRFSLRDQDGRRVTRASLGGRPTVVMFLSTRCNATCVLATSQAKGALDDARGHAAAVAFSIDPLRDTRAAARRLVRRVGMRGRLRFLLGPRREFERVWRGFAIDPLSQRDPQGARLVLVDRQAVQRVGFPLPQATPERIAHDLRILGAE